MSNSAEQLHQKQINMEAQKGNDKRLYIDLDLCPTGECGDCKCSYFYHPENNGVMSITELATYYLVCRRCEEPHCVNACPTQALEQQIDKDKLLVRYAMRCIGCKSCSHACPYGTIYPENLPFLTQNCDFCLDRLNEKGEPLCTKTCPKGAIKIVKGNIELDENTFLVGDNLIIHSTHWKWEKA